MRTSFLTSVFILALMPAFAQNAGYQPLKCEGQIPDDFRTLTVMKHEMDVIDTKENSTNHRVNHATEQFLLETNYLVDELLLSGKILFNDPVSRYINKVADEVLKDQPSLRQKLRFYVVKSPISNAFSTRQGIVFVTLGLISQLENEAQLAFVIGHEVSHYTKEHVINTWKNNNQIFSTNRGYKYNTYEARIQMASSYSKDLELQADSLGITMLNNSRYDLRQAVTSLDVMQYSYLPFDDREFDPHFITFDQVEFPKAFMLDSITPIDYTIDDDDDSRSTHPNMKKRRTAIQNVIHAAKGGNELFIVSKQEFLNARKLARFENIRLLLLDRSYYEAIYHSYLLKQEFPDDHYLDLSIGKGLYGIAKYKNDNSYSDCGDYYGKLEGNIQQCAHLFYQMSDAQSTVIACRYLYDLAKKQKDPFVEDLRDDLFIEMINKHEVGEGYFLKYIVPDPITEDSIHITTDTTKQDTQVTIQEVKKDESTFVSKYDKIRSERDKSSQPGNTSTTVDPAKMEFQKYVFTSLIDDADFSSYFVSIKEKAEKVKAEKKQEEALDSKLTYYQKQAKERAKKQERKSKGVRLGLDKIVVVDPFYFTLDNRKKIRFESSELKLVNFSNDLQNVGQKTGLEVDVIAPKLFNAEDVDKYNEMCLLNDWVGERLDHENRNMIPLNSDYMYALADKHNTDYFMYTGVYSYKVPKENVGAILLAGIVLYPTLPIVIAYLVSPNRYTMYYSLMFNVRNGDCILNENIQFKSKDSRGTLQSMMYDLMLQINRK